MQIINEFNKKEYDIMKNKINNEIQAVNSKIDFTLLDPRATFADLEKLCDIAYKNGYYSVCVNPCNVSYVKGYIANNFGSGLKICSVAGFPLGASSTEVKCVEIKNAIADGADEIDVVINIGRLKSGDYEYVKNELMRIRKVCKKHILKVIIETCYLDENDIVKMCNICAKCKVDFVKTSTGFGNGGATEKDILLMYKTLNGRCLIKASGGIRDRKKAVDLINLGAERIGTSHII